MKNNLLLFAFLVSLLASCHAKENSGEGDAIEPEEVRTPVNVTSIKTVTLNDDVELNATSAYQQSNFIKAPANGYLIAVDIKIGQTVQKGQRLFTLQTKEAHALGNTVNKLDTSFHFTGNINIQASTSGFIQALDHQAGDYVQDGEQLAVLADLNSFGFILNLPVEFRRYVNIGQMVRVDMPDSTYANGSVTKIMPNIDSASQTQSVLIKVSTASTIPQNLIAKIHIVKDQKSNAVTLPKAAVLADDAQTHFWVMKMTDSVTAIKVPVSKGIETKNQIEIIQPHFTDSDKILVSGNYGLPDTAKVTIIKRD